MRTSLFITRQQDCWNVIQHGTRDKSLTVSTPKWHVAWKMLVSILLLAGGYAANAETVVGRVVSVADGDTITVLDAANVQHKIRFSGIDAPEKKQAFGQRSKESLSDMVFGKTVNVETEKRDKYGRQIGKVLINGQDVNLVQVESGMAWFYRQYQRDQSANDQRRYAAAEDSARVNKRGLWRDAQPTPPWDFRHNITGN